MLDRLYYFWGLDDFLCKGVFNLLLSICVLISLMYVASVSYLIFTSANSFSNLLNCSFWAEFVRSNQTLALVNSITMSALAIVNFLYLVFLVIADIFDS